MEESQYKFCRWVMDSLLENPSTRALLTVTNLLYSDKVIRPVNIEYVQNKLDKGFYQTSKEFVSDMRLALKNYIFCTSRKTLEREIAQLVAEYFESLMEKYVQDNDRYTYKLFETELKLAKETNNKFIATKETTNQKAKPAAEIFQTSEHVTTQTLMTELKLLDEIPLYHKAIAYLSELQPETVTVDNVIYVHFCLMKQSTINKLSAYIKEMLRRKASTMLESINQ